MHLYVFRQQIFLLFKKNLILKIQGLKSYDYKYAFSDILKGKEDQWGEKMKSGLFVYILSYFI